MDCTSVIKSALNCCFCYKDNKPLENHENNGINGNNQRQQRGNRNAQDSVHERQPLIRNSPFMDVERNGNSNYGGTSDDHYYTGRLVKSRLSRSILSDKYSFKDNSHIFNNHTKRKVRFESAEEVEGPKEIDHSLSETDRLLSSIVDETAAKMIDVHNRHHGGNYVSRHEANQRSRLYAELVKTLPGNLIPSMRLNVQQLVQKHPIFENGYSVKIGPEYNSKEDVKLMMESTADLEEIMASFKVPHVAEEFVVSFPSESKNCVDSSS